MGNKKAPKNVTSNVSTVANPSASAQTHIASNSSILRSLFAPFRLGAPLFASVIQGFDSQRLRIHDTTNGRLLCEHAIASRATVNCLDWGTFGDASRDFDDDEPKNKKRKRSSLPNGESSAHKIVLAIGTSASEVQIYSPTESKVFMTLKDVHSKGIRDFKFGRDGREGKAYSLGGDGRLAQWNLQRGTAVSSMALPSGPANTIYPTESKVICASHLAYLVDLETEESSPAYNASTNTVHTIISKITQREEHKQFLTIAEIDRSINIFEEGSSTLMGTLRTENEIVDADLWTIGHHSKDRPEDTSAQMTQPEQTLAALNKDGVLEIFPEPFNFNAATSGQNMNSLKARMKNRSRPSTAQVKLVRPGKTVEQVPLIAASFQENYIALAWVEGGVKVLFETLKWREEETRFLLLRGATEIIQHKTGAGLEAITMNGAKDMGKSHVDDSHAVVADGADADDASMDEADQDVIDISSAEEISEFEEDEPVTEPSGAQKDAEIERQDVRGKDFRDDEDDSMGDTGSQGEHMEQEVGSPTFGDLIRANASDPIDVATSLPENHPQSLVPANTASLQPLASGLSLGTVLTQALRTNDTNLLETCFHTQDLSTVRATIERLESSFATALLQRLAERLHSRPGRAGSLMVWIQWTLVAHGGYLAGQPEMMRKLRSLHKVVRERAGSLQSLLSLKGKLDMLEAQMNLRRSILEKGRGANVEDEDEDEDAVIYVEGQEDDDDDEEEEDLDSDEDDAGDNVDVDERGLVNSLGPGATRSRRSNKTDTRWKQIKANDKDKEVEDGAEPLTTNGDVIDTDNVDDDDDDDDDEASNSEEEDEMLDNEASSSGSGHDPSDELAGDEDIDHDSVDDASSSSDDNDDGADGRVAAAAAAPPPVRQVTSTAKGNAKLSNGITSKQKKKKK